MTPIPPSNSLIAFRIEAPSDLSANQLSDWCRNQLRHHLPHDSTLVDGLKICWNPRMRSTAGRAFWPSCRIDLNPAILQLSQEETWKTIRHELSHVLAWMLYGLKISPHGAHWQYCCSLLGIPGESRTHQLPLARRLIPRNYCYTCIHCRVIIWRARPFSSHRACAACCRKYNRGRFDDRFLLVSVPENIRNHLKNQE